MFFEERQKKMGSAITVKFKYIIDYWYLFPPANFTADGDCSHEIKSRLLLGEIMNLPFECQIQKLILILKNIEYLTINGIISVSHSYPSGSVT